MDDNVPPEHLLGASKKTIALERLEEVHSRLAAIVESSGDAIFSKSLDGFLTSWNGAAERLFGYTAEETVGMPMWLIIPDRLHDEELRLFDQVRRGERIEPFETCRRRKDGTEVEVSVSLSPIKDTSGATIGISTIARDITETKRIQRALALAKDTAEAATQELESFAYSVSHDLRAPLRHMDGFSQVLLEDYGDKLGDEAKGLLLRIRAASVRMGRLIDDLLKLSRISRAELEREAVDLSAMARSIVGELRQAEPDRQLSVEIADKIRAQADPRLMGLVLQNLLGNAWKFTAKAANATVTFGVEEQRGRMTYVVRDNGAGFDMAFVGKLFAPFQRLHSAAEFEGTGIGLAIVSRVIQRHGGEIWLTSAIGKGTSVYFTV
jgi:PAS domain S-box-containing protein